MIGNLDSHIAMRVFTARKEQLSFREFFAKKLIEFQKPNKKFLFFALIAGTIFFIILNQLPLKDRSEETESVSLSHKIYQEIKTLPSLIPGEIARRQLPAIRIDLDGRDYKKLGERAFEAREKGVLSSETHEQMSASMTNKEGISYPITVRLKGDWADHAASAKPSFLVRIENEKRFEGMSEFSLMAPERRNFLGEWLYVSALKKQGILAPRFFYIQLFVNGIYRGIYAVEEFFSKELLESQGRQDAPVFKFNEEVLWALRRESNSLESLGDMIFYKPQKFGVEVFDTKRIVADPALFLQAEAGTFLLERLARGELQFCAVFDCKRVASYLALASVFGASHGNMTHNERFYYNPVTGLFEPIAYDNDALASEHLFEGLIGDEALFLAHLARTDLEFLRIYQGAVYRLTDPAFIGGLIEEMENDARFFERALKREYRTYSLDDLFNKMRKGAAGIRSNLVGTNAYAHVRHRFESGTLVIEAANYFPYWVSIEGITVGDTPIALDKVFTCSAPSHKESLTLPPLLVEYALSYTSYCMPLISYSKNDRVQVDIGLVNTDRIIQQESYPLLPRSALSLGLRARGIDLKQYPFLIKQKKHVTIPPGIHHITKDVVIPSGYIVTIAPGAILEFDPRVSFFSFSPVRIGKLGNVPSVKFRSAGNEPWGVFAIIDPEGNSELENASFSNTSEYASPTAHFSGGLSAYRASLSLNTVQFFNTQGQDAVHISESSFVVHNSSIKHAKGDGFDIDFSNGKIVKTILKNIGGDAIDTSSSTVRLWNIEGDGSKDKVLSAGEKSDIEAYNLTAKNSVCGVVSKDQSAVRLFSFHADKISLPLAVYNKKEEYGSAFLAIDSAPEEISSYVLEEGSRLIAQGVSLKANRLRTNDEAKDLCL